MLPGKRLVLTGVLLLLAAGAAVYFFKRPGPAAGTTGAPVVVTVAKPAGKPRDTRSERPSLPPTRSVSPTVVDDSVQEDIQKAVVTYSPEALPTFERFLASNEPDVREAARDGLVQLGEKGGALLLRQATRRMTDPEEIKRMEETAAWLELPSATESPMKRK